MTPLEQFAIDVLNQSRESFADVDGGWIQDRATELGILVPVPVTEACGENCQCAEYGFPADCFRYSEQVQAIRALAQKERK